MKNRLPGRARGALTIALADAARDDRRRAYPSEAHRQRA